jgi:hypothetical protein
MSAIKIFREENFIEKKRDICSQTDAHIIAQEIRSIKLRFTWKRIHFLIKILAQ